MADEPETKNQVENQTPSQEDYDAIKSELEAERTRAQTLVAEATRELTEKVATLETEVATLSQQVVEKTQELNELNELYKLNQLDFEGAKAAYAYAVDDFKKLAAASNPLIPQEAIYGTTIEDIKASLERANKLVANVQESLSKQAQASVVPAGAPARTGPDLSSLSTKEKINLGLEQARKKKEQ